MSDERSCRFCSIVRGEAPAERVFEDEEVLAFLDNRPLFPGHLLVVPRAHVETLLDLPQERVGPLFGRAQALGRALEEALEADGFLLAINTRVSQSVPHLHVHLVPRRFKDGLRGFFWPRKPYDSEEHAREVAERLRAAARRHAAG